MLLILLLVLPSHIIGVSKSSIFLAHCIFSKSSISLQRRLTPTSTLSKCSVEGLNVISLFFTDAHSDWTPPESEMTNLENFKWLMKSLYPKGSTTFILLGMFFIFSKFLVVLGCAGNIIL